MNDIGTPGRRERHRGYKPIGPTSRKEYGKAHIKGLYCLGLSGSDICESGGYAAAGTDNKTDVFAAAVYRKDNPHTGYAPSGNYTLSEHIPQNTGIADCRGVAACYADTPHYTTGSYNACTGGQTSFPTRPQEPMPQRNGEVDIPFRSKLLLYIRSPQKTLSPNIDLTVRS